MNLQVQGQKLATLSVFTELFPDVIFKCATPEYMGSRSTQFSLFSSKNKKSQYMKGWAKERKAKNIFPAKSLPTNMAQPFGSRPHHHGTHTQTEQPIGTDCRKITGKRGGINALSPQSLSISHWNLSPWRQAKGGLVDELCRCNLIFSMLDKDKNTL
ncbi:hypothetical protein NPIL_213921 [Nephila pilipes]|uniref:Uncharacterized protein n=1 Tax=Nephila pilipes TaxID=299642 RepID=A0A8X6P881_NEPPI|nr:hypothetical protein NPIL_213921 [Nephila pilipes]